MRKITNTGVEWRKIGSNIDFRGYVWFRNRIIEIPQAGNQVYVQNIAALVHADEEMWLMQMPKGYASKIFISVTISCHDLHYLRIPSPDYPWIQEVRICIYLKAWLRLICGMEKIVKYRGKWREVVAYEERAWKSLTTDFILHGCTWILGFAVIYLVQTNNKNNNRLIPRKVGSVSWASISAS